MQLKPKFAEVPPEKLQPNMIRASVDLRVPNQYIERSRIAQAPVLEDFTHKFQIRPSPTLSPVNVTSRVKIGHYISTPWGNFRPKRLVFGEKGSQDLFDDAMSRIF